MLELITVATCFGIILSTGILLGLFLFYVLMKVNEFEKFVKGFPTPEEMALQVLKAKVPVNKLTDDQKHKLMEELEKQNKKVDYFG